MGGDAIRLYGTTTLGLMTFDHPQRLVPTVIHLNVVGVTDIPTTTQGTVGDVAEPTQNHNAADDIY